MILHHFDSTAGPREDRKFRGELRRAAVSVVAVTSIIAAVLPVTGAWAKPKSNHSRVIETRADHFSGFLSPRHILVGHASHATFVVDSSFDGTSNSSLCAAGHLAGTCTLRDAILRANADIGFFDRITISSGRHIKLLGGPLLITNSMEIDGTGALINGNGFTALSESGFSNVIIVGLSVSNGNGNGGGALFCGGGSMQLSNVNFSHNSATEGGAVYSDVGCNLWVANSTFSANTASVDGGALSLAGGAYITSSTFGGSKSAAGNIAPQGAGIENLNAAVTITNSIIKYNSSGGSNGLGVGIFNGDNMSVSNCAISYNTATHGGFGAGIDNEEQLQLRDSYINYNTIVGSGDSGGAGYSGEGYLAALVNNAFIGNTTRTTGSLISGGAIYSTDTYFNWTGGSVSQTVAGNNASSDTILGGAAFLSPTNGVVSNVTVDSTMSDSLPAGNLSGGAFYLGTSVTLSGVHVTHSTNRAPQVEGGAIYATTPTQVVDSTIADTTNTATLASGGSVLGGVLYASDTLVLRNDAITSTTNTAKPTPASTYSLIIGGVLDAVSSVNAVGVSIQGVVSTAKGGSGVIFGGALAIANSSTWENSQILGVNVTADTGVQGGVVDNLEQMNALNFTIGTSNIHVLGGVHAGAPFAQGSILYNFDQSVFSNATIANVTTSVPANVQYNRGIDNVSYVIFGNSTIVNDGVTGPTGTSSALLVSESGARTTLLNSIVAASFPWRSCSVVDTGQIQSGGYNIDSGSSCQFHSTSDQSGTSPKVLALAFNGGSVWTAALKKPSSPALNRGNNSTCTATDARGIVRPQHHTCDIGAYELV